MQVKSFAYDKVYRNDLVQSIPTILIRLAVCNPD